MFTPIPSSLPPTLGVCALVLLGACSTLPSAPFVPVPPGSDVVLNAPVVFPPRQYTREIQDGQLVFAADTLRPYCQLRLTKAGAEEPMTLNPDRFTVERTFEQRKEIVGLNTPTPILAGEVPPERGGDDRGLLTYATVMRLASPEQPQVYQLLCGWLQPDELLSDFLTLEQIRATLGGLITLEVAAGN
ncbi:MAG: hypothetical protein ACFCBW_04345 [Candidatus Competibacterales bacterium]